MKNYRSSESQQARLIGRVVTIINEVNLLPPSTVHTTFIPLMLFYTKYCLLSLWKKSKGKTNMMIALAVANSSFFILHSSFYQRSSAPSFCFRFMMSFCMMASICLSPMVFSASCKMKLTAYDFLPWGSLSPS